MKILVVWPPSVPTYFNAGHHLALWETAAYLRKQPGVDRVDVVDGGALDLTWERMARELVGNYDVVAIQNEFDTAPALAMFVGYCRELAPASHILTFGRASQQLPAFFHRYDLDAIVVSGDFEAGVAQYVEWRLGRRSTADVQGVSLRVDGVFGEAGPGLFLPVEDLEFPDTAEIPWDSYNAVYADPALRFSGLARRRELPVPISRGCPMGCGYCLVQRHQGHRERRHSVEAVMDHIDRARRHYAFDYVSTYSPTFTLKRKWVLAFCEAVARHPAGFEWKTCTTLHHLDEELVTAMAASRCVRISVGLESLDPQTHAFLPAPKRIEEEQLRRVAAWCRARNIELNCLVMLGMPGQTPEGLQYTFDVVRDVGAKIRPMIYTDFDALRSDMTEFQLAAHSRQLAADGVHEGMDRQWLYRLRFGDPSREKAR